MRRRLATTILIAVALCFSVVLAAQSLVQSQRRPAGVFVGSVEARDALGLLTTASGPLTAAQGLDKHIVAQAKANPKLASPLAAVAKTFSVAGSSAAGEAAVARGLEVKNGRLTLIVETKSPGQATEAALNAAGATVEESYGNLIQISCPLGKIESLPSVAGADRIRLPLSAIGAATSEGVARINANTWPAAGKTGAGAKVAILDFGFQGYQSMLGSDLPSAVVTRSFRADGDITGGGEAHGTACAEIVHDVAPGAQLYLVNFDTEVEYEQAVDYLISQHVDIVSHSISWFNCDLGDGTGLIDQKVDDASAAGILWFNAAGNMAESHYKAVYSSVPVYDPDFGVNRSFHMFIPAIGVRSGVDLQAGETLVVWMRWPQYPTTAPYYAWHDFDVYLSNAPPEVTDLSTFVAGSFDAQLPGDPNPGYEAFSYTAPTSRTYYILVEDYDSYFSEATPFELFSTHSLEFKTEAGSITCPADSSNAVAVGATNVSNDSIESFSSQGPTTDGRAKPDIVAPDRVSTSSYASDGVGSFWGTSASTPHAAGAAALLRGADISRTMAYFDSYLGDMALDLGTAGFDYLYGNGRLALPNPASVVCPVDHFEISPIPATVMAGIPVPVTITAKDASDNIATGFDNWVPVTAIDGTLEPWKTGAFINGVWSGSVTLTQASLAENIVASIGDFAATSNTFAVTAPVYRFYNFIQGAHFYTTNINEKRYLDSSAGNWTFRDEGIAFGAFSSSGYGGSVAVHRFYNFRQGVHFYTANQAEATYVNNNLYDTFRYEGVSYYAMPAATPAPAGFKTVYRFYNFRQGVHFYTADDNEYLTVLNTAGWTFRYEGVAYCLPN